MHARVALAAALAILLAPLVACGRDPLLPSRVANEDETGESDDNNDDDNDDVVTNPDGDLEIGIVWSVAVLGNEPSLLTMPLRTGVDFPMTITATDLNDDALLPPARALVLDTFGGRAATYGLVVVTDAGGLAALEESSRGADMLTIEDLLFDESSPILAMPLRAVFVDEIARHANDDIQYDRLMMGNEVPEGWSFRVTRELLLDAYSTCADENADALACTDAERAQDNAMFASQQECSTSCNALATDPSTCGEPAATDAFWSCAHDAAQFLCRQQCMREFEGACTERREAMCGEYTDIATGIDPTLPVDESFVIEEGARDILVYNREIREELEQYGL